MVNVAYYLVLVVIPFGAESFIFTTFYKEFLDLGSIPVPSEDGEHPGLRAGSSQNQLQFFLCEL